MGGVPTNLRGVADKTNFDWQILLANNWLFLNTLFTDFVTIKPSKLVCIKDEFKKLRKFL